MQSQKTARPLNFSRVQNGKLFLEKSVSELSAARDYKADLAQIGQIDVTPWTAAAHADMTPAEPVELEPYARS
ncbi:hypothetical protein [Xanthomonas albilineans]|uniref:hypothetical protein n=1 Tax=Xanthomonas albilineans TaxID=29447 RepID=UPI0005F34A69|nr:hypothetical protein [Xanthomonas albilineans]QHQ29355.1 hypothetical protein XaFJ1_GM002642 [Xanthomonas albilineans]